MPERLVLNLMLLSEGGVVLAAVGELVVVVSEALRTGGRVEPHEVFDRPFGHGGSTRVD